MRYDERQYAMGLLTGLVYGISIGLLTALIILC